MPWWSDERLRAGGAGGWRRLFTFTFTFTLLHFGSRQYVEAILRALQRREYLRVCWAAHLRVLPRVHKGMPERAVRRQPAELGAELKADLVRIAALRALVSGEPVERARHQLLHFVGQRHCRAAHPRGAGGATIVGDGRRLADWDPVVAEGRGALRRGKCAVLDGHGGSLDVAGVRILKRALHLRQIIEQTEDLRWESVALDGLAVVKDRLAVEELVRLDLRMLGRQRS